MIKKAVQAESLRDKAMKYYTECQSERAQASASNPSLSSFGSKGSSMGERDTPHDTGSLEIVATTNLTGAVKLPHCRSRFLPLLRGSIC
uniref:Uncharacterized protein n=1 Tax=Timema cristinae TaxID=61476 RepID=A0A7R9GWM7_TIMCR|nr:unnamed protein product [Timema cristinae]